MEPTHELSSGNVFADLGFPHPDQELVKAKLTLQIHQILKHRRLTQTEAARLLGTTQAQVSALMRCRPVSISVGRLVAFLPILGEDVRGGDGQAQGRCSHLLPVTNKKNPAP